VSLCEGNCNCHTRANSLAALPAQPHQQHRRNDSTTSHLPPSLLPSQHPRKERRWKVTIVKLPTHSHQSTLAAKIPPSLTTAPRRPKRAFLLQHRPGLTFLILIAAQKTPTTPPVLHTPTPHPTPQHRPRQASLLVSPPRRTTT
jgi:hypothetical protein